MSVESPSPFAEAIREHLELKERNAPLEREMPLNAYKSEDPFQNHPLFKTEEQARLEETMDGTEPAVATGAPAWPGEETATVEDATAVAAHADRSDLEDSLWGKESRDFDWGD